MKTTPDLPDILATMDRVDALRVQQAPGATALDPAQLATAVKQVYDSQEIPVPQELIEQAAQAHARSALPVSFDSNQGWQGLTPAATARLLLEHSKADDQNPYYRMVFAYSLFGVWESDIRESASLRAWALSSGNPLPLIRWLPNTSENRHRVLWEQGMDHESPYLAGLLLWKLLQHGWQDYQAVVVAQHLPQTHAHAQHIDTQAEAFVQEWLLPRDYLHSFYQKPRFWPLKQGYRSAAEVAEKLLLPESMIKARYQAFGWPTG